MQPLRSALFVSMLLLVLQAACVPQLGPFQLAPQAQAAAQTVSTAAAAPTVEPTVLQPVQLAGPPMQVGSLFRYFDGALLDAVPNQGPFLMGHGGLDDPEHQVTVSDFWIYSVEVSNQMYAQCVALGKCTSPNLQDDPGFADPLSMNYPVVGVNWQQASDYCTYAHGRLPTEAEWEKAASWDPIQKVKHSYPWGDNNPGCDLLNFKNCVNKTTPVVQFAQGRSYYGLLNMEGNVFEWVADWYKPDYYATSPAQDPTGPATGVKRSIRSSAFDSDAYLAVAAWRSAAQPTDHRSNLGFRCVVTDPTYYAPFCTMPVYYGPSAQSAATPNPQPGKPCPDPSLTLADYCATGKTPVQNVTVHNSAPTIVQVTGLEACNPGNNDVGTAHQCAQGVTIHVQASCNVVPAGSPSCPPDYSPDPKNPKQCTSPGGPGACPAGFQYDGGLKCCSAVAGTNAVVPLCAAGQHYFSGVCVDDASGPQPPSSITYTTNIGRTCILPGNNNPGSCTLNPSQCGTLGVNLKTCTCNSPVTVP